MLLDLFLGILGPLLGLFTVNFLGESRLRRKQKILIYLLSGLTFIFYIIFGLLDYSLKEGSEINLGIFQISYGISESLLILLIVVVPILLGIFLLVAMQNFKWSKRLSVSLLLAIVVGSINFFQTYRELNQHQWDFEDGFYENCLALNCEE